MYLRVHVKPSLSKKKPRGQTQWNDPTVLLHSCEHLTATHSSTSEKSKNRHLWLWYLNSVLTRLILNVWLNTNLYIPKQFSNTYSLKRRVTVWCLSYKVLNEKYYFLPTQNPLWFFSNPLLQTQVSFPRKATQRPLSQVWAHPLIAGTLKHCQYLEQRKI